MTYTYRQGETITIALDALEGNISLITDITANIALLDRGDEELSAKEVAESIPMDVTNRPMLGEIPAGWDFTLEPQVSATLEPGDYRVDAKIEVGGGIEITGESARIRITRAATS